MAKGWKGIINRAAEPGILPNPHELASRPFAFMCPQPNCYYAVSAESEALAKEIQAEHPCPYIGGITHIGSTVTLTLVEQLWEKADQTLDRLDSAIGEKRDLLRGQLNGICISIAVFMPPLYHTAAEVAEEIRKRKVMRDAQEPYETPGLGSRRYETAATANPRAATVAERAAKVLTDQDKKAIKYAMESKMFTVEQVASTYNVTVEVIQAVVS